MVEDKQADNLSIIKKIKEGKGRIYIYIYIYNLATDTKEIAERIPKPTEYHNFDNEEVALTEEINFSTMETIVLKGGFDLTEFKIIRPSELNPHIQMKDQYNVKPIEGMGEDMKISSPLKKHKGDPVIDTMTPFTPPETFAKIMSLESQFAQCVIPDQKEHPEEKKSLSPRGKMKLFREAIGKLITRPGLTLRLPESEFKATIVLDLDETMISNLKTSDRVYSAIMWKVPGLMHSEKGIYFVCRPGLQDFLQNLKDIAEIVVFTASHPIYAMEICTTIQKEYNLQFDAICTSLNCHSLGSKGVIKDLQVIQNRNIQDMLVIDDLIKIWPFDTQNVVQIPPFKGTSKDVEFENIYPNVIDFINNVNIKYELEP